MVSLSRPRHRLLLKAPSRSIGHFRRQRLHREHRSPLSDLRANQSGVAEAETLIALRKPPRKHRGAIQVHIFGCRRFDGRRRGHRAKIPSQEQKKNESLSQNAYGRSLTRLSLRCRRSSRARRRTAFGWFSCASRSRRRPVRPHPKADRPWLTALLTKSDASWVGERKRCAGREQSAETQRRACP
jgi:hypothetical protein